MHLKNMALSSNCLRAFNLRSFQNIIKKNYIFNLNQWELRINSNLHVKNFHTSEFRNGLRSKWRAPTLRELKKRADILKNDNKFPQDIRSQYIEWNYDAELFAFGKRFNEEFDDDLLREAFTDSSYIFHEKLKLEKLGMEVPDIQLKSNEKLAESGMSVIYDFCLKYIRHASPLLPEEGVECLTDYLSSEATLSKIAKELGFRDLILTQEYPPRDKTYATAFTAVIGCLNASSGLERCHRFILDFVITQLIGKDLWDIWKIENPQHILKQILISRGQNEPEPRLMGSLGSDTIESVFQVGIYDSNKELIGTGYGETIEVAVEVASYDALARIFGHTISRTPMIFKKQDLSALLKCSPNQKLQEYR